MTVTNPGIDLALARHPDTPASVLQRLSKDLEAETRVAVAKHPNTAPDTLTELAEDDSAAVRAAVQKNMNAPRLVRFKLFLS